MLNLPDEPTISNKDLQLNTWNRTREETDSLVLADQEKQSMMQTLEKNHRNKTATAALPELSLRQLHYYPEKLDIE